MCSPGGTCLTSAPAALRGQSGPGGTVALEAAAPLVGLGGGCKGGGPAAGPAPSSSPPHKTPGGPWRRTALAPPAGPAPEAAAARGSWAARWLARAITSDALRVRPRPLGGSWPASAKGDGKKETGAIVGRLEASKLLNAHSLKQILLFTSASGALVLQSKSSSTEPPHSLPVCIPQQPGARW